MFKLNSIGSVPQRPNIKMSDFDFLKEEFFAMGNEFVEMLMQFEMFLSRLVLRTIYSINAVWDYSWYSSLITSIFMEG